jgi:hypothetical protein
MSPAVSQGASSLLRLPHGAQRKAKLSFCRFDTGDRTPRRQNDYDSGLASVSFRSRVASVCLEKQRGPQHRHGPLDHTTAANEVGS